MPTLRKVAFVTSLASAYGHRLLRGALSYAESRPQLMVREFRISREVQPGPSPDDMLHRLLAWSPDGLLSYLENEELEQLLDLLPRRGPVASLCAVRRRPGVAVVSASFNSQVEMAVNHFRHQGLRSIALVLLESEEQMESKLAASFLHIARPGNPAQAVFSEVIHPSLLDDCELPVGPVPERLAGWLRSLPRPTGVLCPQAGGGGYLIRVCHHLGLRVPEDVAVIGADDADVSLATHPSQTSVVPVGETVGFEAMRVLEEMIHGHPAPKGTVLLTAMDLHVRQSTGLLRAQVCDIAAAVDYIHRHVAAGLSVEQVLKATQQVSKKTFQTYFKAATGMTPGEAIRRSQLEQARRLLVQTELSVTHIAGQSGFGSSSDFARRFRLEEGVSPTAYRSLARTSPVDAPL